MKHIDILLEIENRSRGIKINGEIENIVYTYSGGCREHTLVPKSLFGLIIDPLPEGISFEQEREYFSMETYKDFIEFMTSVGKSISYGVPIYMTQEEILDEDGDEDWDDEYEEDKRFVFKGIIEYLNTKIATFGDYSQPRIGMGYNEWRAMPFEEYALRWINHTIWKWVVVQSVFLEIIYKNGNKLNLVNFRSGNQ